MLPSVFADQTAAENYSLYSGWQAAPDRQNAVPATRVKVGSFRLQRPSGEAFIDGLYGTTYEVLSAIPPSQDELEHYLQARTRSQLTTPETPGQTFGDYLRQRAHGAPQQLLRNSTDYLNDAFRTRLRRQAADARFLHNIELDIQTPLGERRGQGGLSALGALRETEREVIAWQLRGYTAEDSGKGANAGLIYRRAANLAGNSLLGGNVFVDFEHQGKANERLWRWSVGGEYRNAYGDLYANYYFPITDPIIREDKLYYTQEGLDVELNADILSSRYGSLAGGLGYYHWQGIRREPDDSGLRYHLRASPDSGNLFIELQLDTPEEGSADWGGRISYRHFIHGAASGGHSLLEDKPAFDAHKHFFAPVRREYAQRIRTLIITDVQVQALAGAARLWRAGGAAPVVLAPEAAAVVLSRPLTAAVATGAGGTVELAQLKAWTATVYQNTTLSLHLGNDGSTLYLDGGNVYLTRRSNPNNLNRVEMFNGNDRVTIDLYGTQCYFTAGDNRSLVCDEGEVRATLNNFADLAMRYGGSSVTILVDYAPDSTNLDNRETVTLNCNSAEARMRHRQRAQDFPGCFGDAQVNMPLENNNRVEVVSNGQTLTVERRDGETIIEGASYTITVAGTRNIPLSPYNLQILTPDTNGEMVEVLMPTANMRPSIDSDNLAPQMVSHMMENGLQLANGIMISASDRLDCVPDSAPDSNNVVSCGNIAFKGIDAAAPYLLYARVGEPQTITLDIAGGSGRFRVALQRRRGEPLLTTETNSTVDDKVILTVNAAAAGESGYRLRVEEGHSLLAQAGVVEAAEITVQVHAARSLSAPVQSTPFSVAVTRGKNTQIYSGEFSHVAGRLSYQITYNREIYSTQFAVKADSGARAVTVSLLGVPFAQATEVTITIIASDDADDSKATLLVRVHAREPGAINYYASYSRSDHVNYENAEVPEYNRRDVNMSDPESIQLYVDIYGHDGLSGGLVTLRVAFMQKKTDEGGYFNTDNFRVRETIDNGHRRIAVLIGERRGTDIPCGDYRALIILEDESGQQARIERAFRVVDAVSGTVDAPCRSRAPSRLSAPLVSGPLPVYTQVPTERVLYTKAFSNVSGRISYEAPTFSSNEEDFIVEATDGNNRVVIRNRGGQPNQSLAQRPFPDEVNITISIVARDSGDNSTATLVLTVQARDPDARELRFNPSRSGGFLRTTVAGGYTWYVYNAVALGSGELGQFSSPFLAGLTAIGFFPDYEEGFNIYPSGRLVYSPGSPPPLRDFQLKTGLIFDHSRVPNVLTTIRIRIDNPNIPPFVAPPLAAPIPVYTQVNQLGTLLIQVVTLIAPGNYPVSFDPLPNDQAIHFSNTGGLAIYRLNRQIMDETTITISRVARDETYDRILTVAVTFHVRDPGAEVIRFEPQRHLDNGYRSKQAFPDTGHIWYVYELSRIKNAEQRPDVLGLLPFSVDAIGYQAYSDSNGFAISPAGEVTYTGTGPNEVVLRPRLRLSRQHSRLGSELSNEIRIRIME